jgi:hypothetical protein
VFVACGTKSAKNKTSHESSNRTARDFRRRRLDVTNASGVVETSDSEEEASEASLFFPSSSFPVVASVGLRRRSDGFPRGWVFFSSRKHGVRLHRHRRRRARAAWGGVRGLRIFVFRLGSVYTTGLCLCLSARRGVEVGGGSDPADVWTFFFPRVGGLVASPGVAVSRAAKPRRFTRGAPLVAGGGIVGSVFFGD